MKQRQTLWMKADNCSDCSLNSFTVIPEDASSDVLGREWSPGRGWDTASERGCSALQAECGGCLGHTALLIRVTAAPTDDGSKT